MRIDYGVGVGGDGIFVVSSLTTVSHILDYTASLPFTHICSALSLTLKKKKVASARLLEVGGTVS